MKKYIENLNLISNPDIVVDQLLNKDNKNFKHLIFFNTHSYVETLKNSSFMRSVLKSKHIFSDINIPICGKGYISPEKANELTVSRNAFPSHVLFDPSGVVGRKYSAKTTPHMYIIDEQGLLKYQGAIDDAGGRGFMSKDLFKANNYVKKGLKELASGEEISSPVTKPYGCSVKYSS